MDKRTKGQHAQRLLDDEVLQMAFDGVVSYHTRTFSDVGATDEQVLEARRDLMALKRVQGQLRKMVSDGKIVEKDQDRGSD